MLTLQLTLIHTGINRPTTVNMAYATHWYNEENDNFPYTYVEFMGGRSILVTETKEEIDEAVKRLIAGVYLVAE